MVSYDKNSKNLVVPSSLGNFQTNGGGGMTPEEVQNMIDSSITEYDETVQGYISDVEVDVEQNKDDIETLSGLTSSMGEDIASLSAQTAQISGITAQIEALSGSTEQNATDIGTLSGKTEEIENSLSDFATTAVTSGLSNELNTLSGATAEIENKLQDFATTAVTSAITGDLEQLSGATQGIEQQLVDFATTAVTESIAGDLEELSGITSGISEGLEALSAYTQTIPTGSTGGGDYVVVDALSAITSPKEGMKAYVNPVGPVMNRMTLLTIPEGKGGWSGGLSGFDGADLDFYANPLEVFTMPYNPNIDTVYRNWQMAATNLYTRYEDGALYVIWDNATWPNASVSKWGDDTWLSIQEGQFIADTREEAGRTYVYRGGKWVEDKKIYFIPDLRTSTGLTKDICDRTALGEMDIMLRYTRATFPCYTSQPNNWSNGETIFKGFFYQNNALQLWRWFIRRNDYGLGNDSEGQIPPSA